jgi:hypothetical protein
MGFRHSVTPHEGWGGGIEEHVNLYHDFSQRSGVTPRAVSSVQILDAAGAGTEGKPLGEARKRS